jgi:two-component system, cell cycle sensor histidine kinase and response regulator CckA
VRHQAEQDHDRGDDPVHKNGHDCVDGLVGRKQILARVFPKYRLASLLSVQDTGLGMDAETRAHLFEPFFTTKPIGKGTGLGLATVFGIVKQSGGFIFAESEIGKGTTFRIYFPKADSDPQTAEIPKSHALPTRTATVLLVEDEPAFRDLLMEWLESSGYRVLVGQNGVEALHVAGHWAETLDILLTDLAKCIREVHPEVEVLYMSGYTDDKLQLVSSDHAVALLQKPFSVHDLLRKIEELLNRPAAPISRHGVVGR